MSRAVWVLLVLAIGCVAGSRVAADFGAVTVEACNNSWSHVTFYAHANSYRQRLGDLTPFRCGNFRVPQQMTATGGMVQFSAKLLAGTTLYTDHGVNTAPGDRIQLVLENSGHLWASL